jgi:hypothetical protein
LRSRSGELAAFIPKAWELTNPLEGLLCENCFC